MYAQDNDLHFYSTHYSLILNLDKLGGVSGFLIPLEDSSQKYPLRGYYVNQNGLMQFAFTIDWSFVDEKNWGFTCFSGQFVNNHILIVDWMLVKNNTEDYGICGSDCLSSSLYINERKNLPNNIKPFPIELAILLESRI